jgi:hypothetical protein
MEIPVYQGKSGDWKCRRGGVTGQGKTKKKALADLLETERFKRIAEKK